MNISPIGYNINQKASSKQQSRDKSDLSFGINLAPAQDNELSYLARTIYGENDTKALNFLNSLKRLQKRNIEGYKEWFCPFSCGETFLRSFNNAT